MANWLKLFDQTALGLLFTDQYLSPSEVVKIAQTQRRADNMQCCIASAKSPREKPPHTQLVGLR